MSNDGVAPPLSKRSRFDMEPISSNNSSTPNGLAVQEMLAKASRELEEKKKLLQSKVAEKMAAFNLSQASSVSSVNNSQIKNESNLNSKDRIALLTAQIHARMINAKVGISGNEPGSRPTPLILDSQGRTIDQSGKEVQLVQRVPTLKANIRAQKKEQIIKLTTEKARSEADSQYTDNSLYIKGPNRGKRSFRFHEKGTFETLGQKLRTKAQLDQLQKEIAENSKKTGISAAARLALLSSIVPKKETKEEDIPDVEWWDSFVMKDDSYDDCLDDSKDLKDKFEGITHLIEHPIQIKPLHESVKEIPVPVFLTKKEQKKLRRVNRREAWKEKQEKIRMGLEEPPEPKLKLSNMMRAMGQQAIQDPTKIEAHVKEQMMRRQKTHEETNSSRALTSDQKKAKKANKIKEDTSLGVNVAVYRVLNLQNPAKKFKVEANIKQLQMSGIVVIYKNINVIVTEGGPKQQKKFRRLLMNRIKWNEEEVDLGDKKVENKCFLVWEGMVKQRSFNEAKFKISPNESFARELFKNHGVEHYWDLAFSMSILDSTES